MLKIQGGQTVSGVVRISGSKNAALKIIPAALFYEKAIITNVPNIWDVRALLKIIESLWVVVQFEKNTVTLDTVNLSLKSFDRDLIKKIRVGIMLIPALLSRLGLVEMPYPGGCNIGKRWIDEHLDGFRSMGYHVSFDGENIAISGQPKEDLIECFPYFSVTATENMIIANAWRKGKTIIRLAAIEPHVMNLIHFLRDQWAEIELGYDHTITIFGKERTTTEAKWEIISDYIESGTFVVLWALASREYIDIEHARIGDLQSFLLKCREVGVKFEDRGNDTLRVFRSIEHLQAVKLMQTNIFPGFPTDLQSPFTILLTQSEGISRVQEVLFEGRLNWLVEIEKMKGHPAILNPHEALIFGKTHLRGATVSSWDLRAGVAMILAGLIAEGETRITNVEYIDRGYEDIIGKMEKLGAVIERVEEVN